MRFPSWYPLKRYVLNGPKASLMLVEDDCSHRNFLSSSSCATDIFLMLDSIHISTCSWDVHEKGWERGILFGGTTVTVTNRPFPCLGPKPHQFCTTLHIEMRTSSRSIRNSESIPYRHKDWPCTPLNNSDFAGIDIYWLSAVECIQVLMKTSIIHISLIDWILQLVSRKCGLRRWYSQFIMPSLL